MFDWDPNVLLKRKKIFQAIHILVYFPKNNALQITAITLRTTHFGEKVLDSPVNLFFTHFTDMETRNVEHTVLSVILRVILNRVPIHSHPFPSTPTHSYPLPLPSTIIYVPLCVLIGQNYLFILRFLKRYLYYTSIQYSFFCNTSVSFLSACLAPMVSLPMFFSTFISLMLQELKYTVFQNGR